MSHTATLHNWRQASDILAKAAAWIRRRVEDGQPVRLTLEEQRRTIPQNRRMWAMLSEVSRQVDWYGHKLTDEEWKQVFTAAMLRQKTVPGIDGGFVVLGQSTSTMSTEQLSSLMEMIAAFGEQHDVRFTNE
jgi:hypothetical protein